MAYLENDTHENDANANELVETTEQDVKGVGAYGFFDDNC